MNQALTSLSVTSHIRVFDEWHQTLPDDLYIPPAAFEILLEQFEGPLDFLIYLIRKNGFDLLQVDIAPIAAQYLAYMEDMKSLNIELTADYMVMAALLADLKSRLLLPKPVSISLEKDPKHALIDRLEEYLRIKQAAQQLNRFEILERDTFNAQVSLALFAKTPPAEAKYDANLLSDALFLVFNRPVSATHTVVSEPVLLEERMTFIENKLKSGDVLSFAHLLIPTQGRMGMVVTFMAVLELSRQQKIQIVHSGLDHPLHIQGVLA